MPKKRPNNFQKLANRLFNINIYGFVSLEFASKYLWLRY